MQNPPEISNLKDYSGEYQVVNVKDVYEKEKHNQKPVLFGSGIGTLDEFIGGFKEGQLIVITGQAKRGKTTLAKSITRNIVDKMKVLWFSFEESIYEFYQDIQGVDFYVPEKMKHKDMDWLYERILESKEKYGTNVVFIDHLHYLFTISQGNTNTALLIGDLMRDLKRIAVEQKLVIFILAHTKKIDGNRIPRAEDVRDSALIANECDKMFVVHRDRSDGDLGMSTLSPDTKVVIELDRQNGSSMGLILTLAYKDGILTTKHDEDTPKPQKNTRVADKTRADWNLF